MAAGPHRSLRRAKLSAPQQEQLWGESSYDWRIPLRRREVFAAMQANMITPETFSHIENIKKRAGYLWRFL
ncbi:MAG: hypothetical protein PHQ04_08170 [Opitutaceae bacterium]|nr:hypothetical protein [Opitutaceae bacterium]